MGDWFFGKRDEADVARKLRESQAQSDLRAFLESQRLKNPRSKSLLQQQETAVPTAGYLQSSLSLGASRPRSGEGRRLQENALRDVNYSTRDRNRNWDNYQASLYHDSKSPSIQQQSNQRGTWDAARLHDQSTLSHQQNNTPPLSQQQQQQRYTDTSSPVRDYRSFDYPTDDRRPRLDHNRQEEYTRYPHDNNNSNTQRQEHNNQRGYIPGQQYSTRTTAPYTDNELTSNLPYISSTHDGYTGKRQPANDYTSVDIFGQRKAHTTLPFMHDSQQQQLNVSDKTAQQQHYLRDLEIQVMLKKQKQEEEKARLRKEDEKKMKEIMDYNPFGKGGGGAPLRNTDGSILTNLSVAKKQQGGTPGSSPAHVSLIPMTTRNVDYPMQTQNSQYSGLFGMQQPLQQQHPLQQQQQQQIQQQQQQIQQMQQQMQQQQYSMGAMGGVNPAFGYPGLIPPGLPGYPQYPNMPYGQMGGYNNAGYPVLGMIPPQQPLPQASLGIPAFNAVPIAPVAIAPLFNNTALPTVVPPPTVGTGNTGAVSHLRGHIDQSTLPVWQQEEMQKKQQVQNTLQDALRQQIIDKEKKKKEEEAQTREEDRQELERLYVEQVLLKEKHARELAEDKQKQEEIERANQEKDSMKQGKHHVVAAATTTPVQETTHEALLRAQAEAEALKRKNKRRHVDNNISNTTTSPILTQYIPPSTVARVPSPPIPTLRGNANNPSSQHSPPLPSLRNQTLNATEFSDPTRPSSDHHVPIASHGDGHDSDINPVVRRAQTNHAPTSPPVSQPPKRVVVIDNGHERPMSSGRRRRASAVGQPVKSTQVNSAAAQSVLAQLSALKNDLEAEQRKVERDLAGRNAILAKPIARRSQPSTIPTQNTPTTLSSNNSQKESTLSVTTSSVPLPSTSILRPSSANRLSNPTAAGQPMGYVAESRVSKPRGTWGERPQSRTSTTGIDIMDKLNETRSRRLNALETLGNIPRQNIARDDLLTRSIQKIN